MKRRCYVFYINDVAWKIYGGFPTWNQKDIELRSFRRENNIADSENLKSIVKVELR